MSGWLMALFVLATIGALALICVLGWMDARRIRARRRRDRVDADHRMDSMGPAALGGAWYVTSGHDDPTGGGFDGGSGGSAGAGGS